MVKKLILFDVDGTLTPSRGVASYEMVEVLKSLGSNDNYVVGFVGGSNLPKQHEQLGDCMNLFDYWFPENGLVAYKNSKEFFTSDLMSFFTEDTLKEFIGFCLHYIADVDIPKKRGTFFEYRTGLINVCPVGRDCSQAERNEYEIFDNENHIRENMIIALKNKFPDLDLHYSIGGQISFDVFPKGWDKTFCLNHFNLDDFSEVHFFGDKTLDGENDYEIFSDSRVIGHSVKSPLDTIEILRKDFL
jgi:phosphomannomutase